ncbi:MAG: tRNA (adenosine(37)-N6)-threonylcarbamoyltransferase complex transferase subunit TsaD [Coriobacteriia bacterium]|nr:tRNA (adenosine(37)-N6)-threonylcarbamoyltransferase complex transferase subunit TsaD [Coriobacteriia bacterium]
MSKNLVLAFDTASEHIALAVGTLNGHLIAADNHPARREANVQLMPSVDALFSANKLDKKDIACVVCGRGPGSFTGVRIAISTAKGIARGLGVPLFGVSTMESIAWNAHQTGIRGVLGVVTDALRSEVYPARFNLTDAGVIRRDAHTVAKAEAVAELWNKAGEPLILAGDGLRNYFETFMFGVALSFVSEAQWIPTGQGLLQEFWAARKRGEMALEGDADFSENACLAGEPAALLPIYTRLSDAEENERKRLADDGAIAQGALVEVPQSGVADPALAEQIIYRPMATSDLEQVVALETKVFSAEVGAECSVAASSDGATATSPASVTSGECWTQAMFADELPRPDRSWWVAYKNNALVGFVGGWVVDGQLHVLDIAVEPAYRRQGVGRGLMLRLIEDAAALGATSTTLEVRISNEGAQAFYAALGLEQEGIRPHYYAPRCAEGEREDALILSSKDVSVLVSSGGVSTGAAGDEALAGAAGGGTTKDTAQEARAAIKKQSSPHILAIETSCDETAAAVIDGSGQVLSNIIASQVDFHARFGGVVPEIASRKHTENIVSVVDAALADGGIVGASETNTNNANTGIDKDAIDAIAVTYAPGLIGALVVGLAFAKGLSWALDKPLIKINHLEGHIYSNRLDNPKLKPPFIIALLSGGNTMLVHVRKWGDYEVLGQTLDDAVGEAFDKVAKALGLGYPGGPILSTLAEQGNPAAIEFPRALINSGDFDFSLSGLKTAVVTYIKQEQEAGREINVPDLAASFERAVIDVQVAKALAALKETKAKVFCLGGGVAANKALRFAYKEAMEAQGIKVIAPAEVACTDNAAMIAAVALDRFQEKRFASLADDAAASTNLEEAY